LPEKKPFPKIRTNFPCNTFFSLGIFFFFLAWFLVDREVCFLFEDLCIATGNPIIGNKQILL
jgi:hypothetical protein